MKVDNKKHRDEICKLGQGEETCAFIAVGADGFICHKGGQSESFIRQRLALGTWNAKGDNCDGCEPTAEQAVAQAIETMAEED